MSTRSRIGVIRSKSEIESIYCHFDGYPTEVGAKLRDHWTDVVDVDFLIAGGDLSILGSILGSKHDFDQHSSLMREHGNDWCLFYRRDRGEEDVDSLIHEATSWPDYGQEYEYLFDPSDRSWTCRSLYRETDWKPLAAAIAADRLEELRFQLQNESISYGELAELQSLVDFIDPSDVELLEAAGVPEHTD